MYKQAQGEPGGVGLRIVSVAGTRPEAIKFAPLIVEAARRPGIDHRLLATGQQDALFDDTLAAFGLRADVQTDAGWQAGDRAGARRAIAAEMERERPDLVLVQGDTDSALVAAQAAHSLNIPIGHLEAGLRSRDLTSPYPEEQNRVAIAQLATLHFAPCNGAAVNLRAEGVGGSVFVTGNSGIDALLNQRVFRACDPAAGPILVTCHRRENFGVPLERICSALATLAAKGLRFLVPLHSNPNSADAIRTRLSDCPGVTLVPPMPYRAMIEAMAEASFVLSDSGGLQEECAALGVPLLLLRENTERPEVVESGNCVLVGSDSKAIIEWSLRLDGDADARRAMAKPYFPYGRGEAATQILDAIETWHVEQSGPKSVQIGPASFCAEARPDL